MTTILYSTYFPPSLTILSMGSHGPPRPRPYHQIQSLFSLYLLFHAYGTDFIFTCSQISLIHSGTFLQKFENGIFSYQYLENGQKNMHDNTI